MAILKNWKVTVSINDRKEEKTIFVRKIDTIENAYLAAKRYFIVEHPEIDFGEVLKAEII